MTIRGVTVTCSNEQDDKLVVGNDHQDIVVFEATVAHGTGRFEMSKKELQRLARLFA